MSLTTVTRLCYNTNTGPWPRPAIKECIQVSRTMLRGRALLHRFLYCLQSHPTTQQVPTHPLPAAVLPLLNRSCSSSSKPAPQRCASLHMLHGAVAMGHNIIPEPAAAKQVETEGELEELFPFTWNISQFRGRDIGERGLFVHYVPQVCPSGRVSVLQLVNW